MHICFKKNPADLQEVVQILHLNNFGGGGGGKGSYFAKKIVPRETNFGGSIFTTLPSVNTAGQQKV